MKSFFLTLGLLALAQPVFAQTVLETDFTISVPDGSGGEVVESSTLVPLLAGTCYNWHIKLGKVKGSVEVTEIYTLPAAPESWGLDEANGTVLNEAKDQATTVRRLTPDDGWIGDGWCVADGDPTGDYSFEIKSGDEVLATFPFQVEEM